jgi:DNA-directed RNA polymerase subunit alpha
VITISEPIFEIQEEKSEKNVAKFVISPLEQGYGHTLGNSLRRVLLKSLSGAAVTTVRVSSVKHQFSTLKGMKEDVVDFVLNLKKVRLNYDGEKPVKAKISAKGPGEVKAKDIDVSPEVKISNPELVLAYLNKDAKLEAELTIETGQGYSPAEERTERTIGLIPLDASFSPVMKVNYKVEETRVGRLTNYDKLILEIATDGTVTAKDALTSASNILLAYFSQIVSPKKVQKAEKPEIDALGPIGKLSVEEIGLPTRVANALVKAGYETVEEIVNADRRELVKVRNLGEKSLKIVNAALVEKGVQLP